MPEQDPGGESDPAEVATELPNVTYANAH